MLSEERDHWRSPFAHEHCHAYTQHTFDRRAGPLVYSGDILRAEEPSFFTYVSADFYSSFRGGSEGDSCRGTKNLEGYNRAVGKSVVEGLSVHVDDDNIR